MSNSLPVQLSTHPMLAAEPRPSVIAVPDTVPNSPVADLLEIGRRALNWRAPSHIFHTYHTASYSYIFEAPVWIASILARETTQTVTVATHPEDVKLPAANETDSESSSDSLGTDECGAQWV